MVVGYWNVIKHRLFSLTGERDCVFLWTRHGGCTRCSVFQSKSVLVTAEVRYDYSDHVLCLERHAYRRQRGSLSTCKKAEDTVCCITCTRLLFYFGQRQKKSPICHFYVIQLIIRLSSGQGRR